MLRQILRWIERLAVLLIGIGAVYAAIYEVFPFFDNRLPLAIALFVTYVTMAYVALPAVLRLIRLFIQPDHIPMYCVTPDGFPSDPVNVGLIGTRRQVIKAMQAGGWYMADRKTARTLLKLIYTTLARQAYPNAPFSNLYLFGRKQDLGFEKPVSGDSRHTHRHHVRFWACHLGGPEQFHQDVNFWQRWHLPRTSDPSERQLWVGAASKDIGIRLIRHNAQLTHMVHPDTNLERAIIVRDLKQTRYVRRVRSVTVGTPFELRNRVIRGVLQSDGRMAICELRT